jgi:hypothetical protein
LLRVRLAWRFKNSLDFYLVHGSTLFAFS